MERALRLIERVGNRLPQPFILFIYLCLALLVASFVVHHAGWTGVNPKTQSVVTAHNLISVSGFQTIMQKMVINFAHFAPFGLVLVMLMGVSLAEKSGLLESYIRLVTSRVPDALVIPIIVIAAACGNVGSDAGIVIVPPIAAIIFRRMGRHPLAGLVLGYAAATAGFTANLIPAGTDVLLAAITSEVYGAITPGAEVVATCNWYFMVVATFVLAGVGTVVALKATVPLCERYEIPADQEIEQQPLSSKQKRGLAWATVAGAIYIAAISMTIIPEDGILRDPDPAQLMRSPFFKSLIPIFFFLFILVGYTYGKVVGTIKKGADAVGFMIEALRSLAPYIALCFMIAQFINLFKWSRLDQLIAIGGARLLEAMNISGLPLFLAFIVMVAAINLFMGSGAAKWAILAPIFVTMLMHLNISPAATQLLYRIGDSVTNGMSPTYSFFPLMLGWVQQYDKKAGVGTVVSLLVPYAAATLMAWMVLLCGWYLLGLPIGIGESFGM